MATTGGWPGESNGQYLETVITWTVDSMNRTNNWGVSRKLATSVNQGDTILTMIDVLNVLKLHC